MLVLLSPAKTMSGSTTITVPAVTQPLYLREAEHIAWEMAAYSVDELAGMLGTNRGLALQTKERYSHFHSPDNRGLPALLAYTGIVFRYMAPADFSKADFEYAQSHFLPDYRNVAESAINFLDEELDYQRRCRFLLPEDGKQEINRSFLHRTGQLKKYIESDLYILSDKKSNVFFWQQVFFMIAAGLSMVFATVISFSFQQTYGNFTLPLFIALVVSYMFKDRIKDLMHYWFANKLGSKFYDYKMKLALHGDAVGWAKEGCDFVNEEKLPYEIRAQRGRVSELEAGYCALRETVLVYRRRVSILGKQLRRLSHFPLEGLNDIIRINLRDFLRRMDSPHVPVYINEGQGDFHIQQAEKVYYLHFVIRYRYQGKTGYKRFRVGLTRRGIMDLMEW